MKKCFDILVFCSLHTKEIIRLCTRWSWCWLRWKAVRCLVSTLALNLEEDYEKNSMKSYKLALMRTQAEVCQIKRLKFSAMWNGSNESDRSWDATWRDQFAVLFFFCVKIERKVRWSSQGPLKCPKLTRYARKKIHNLRQSLPSRKIHFRH